MNHIYLAIFLVSSSILILEVSIIRLFSIYLSYHFAFMVVSIAMLGIGSAGAILAIRSRDSLTRESTDLNIGNYALCAGLSIILSYTISNYIPFDPVRLSWERMQILYMVLYCLVLSIPFLFSGILIATAFFLFSKKSEIIYTFDLLGAGIGSLTVVVLLNISGPEYAVLSASTLCFVGAAIVGKKNIKVLSVVFILINLQFFIFHPDFISVRISPYKSLPISLKFPGAEHLKTYYNSLSRIDTLKSPAVRFAPGLSLTYLNPLPEQIGISIDGSEMNAVTKADDKDSLKFLRFLPSAVVYEISKKKGESVLILDSKGGLQALMAEYYGFKKVHKVESNPLLIRIIREDFREFSGGIFEHNTWSGLGRSWLSSSRLTPPEADHGSRFYDIIELPITGTSVTGVFGITEDYRYTVEAFKEYLDALDSEGILSISLYLVPPPRQEFRILATIITALEDIGIGDIHKKFTCIRSWDTMTILVKKQNFTNDQIDEIKEFSRSKKFDLVYYPGIREEETNIYIKTPANEYFKGVKNLINPQSRKPFINNYLFDIKPVYDENPFFHYYLRLKNLRVIYEVMGQKWLYFLEEGYLTPLIFLIVLILSIIMILLPVSFKTRFEQFKQLKQFELLFAFLYFAMLGLGFMFIEVTFIQKNILLLGNPAYSVSIVLTTILISSGTGSMLSSRFNKLGTSFMVLVLSCLIFFYSLMYPLILNFILPYSMVIKIMIIFITLLPLGLLMGIPFPMGIKVIGKKDAKLIPWAWAINACLSVLAPILTIMFAMTFGFRTVLWLGSLAYLLAFISLRRLSR